MSRTDVHRPYWVQAADPYNRHRYRRFQRWPMEEPILIPLYSLCGCSLCSWGREDRRRERHQAQRLCRELTKNSEE